MRLSIYNNSKSKKPNEVKFHVSGTTKVTKQEIKIRSTSFKSLVKQCSSKSGDETYVLRRFLNKNCTDMGDGQYIAGKLETGNNFLVFINESWTIATVVQREGRSYTTKNYEMVIADKEGKMGVVYNIYSNTEIVNGEPSDSVTAEDINTLLEVIRIKDRQIEKLAKVNKQNAALGEAVLSIANSDSQEQAVEKAKVVTEVFADELAGLTPVKNEYFYGIKTKIDKTIVKNPHYKELNDFEMSVF
ncbi:hypothetical protein [Pantoea stewartii]|uniref:hypothetical protein n=1 Tax=Pantoea stewartii TaxID=66269 RepID=UPI00197D8977|nr:hypothetical protein [Pantoea stewartii]